MTSLAFVAENSRHSRSNSTAERYEAAMSTMALKLGDLPTEREQVEHAQYRQHNLITTETIAIYSVTTSILWTQSYMLGHTFALDGSTVNTSGYKYWWYTPTSGVARGGTNVDVGAQALLETANMCYGAALYIFGTILFLRAITNVAIVHPKNKTGEPGIAFFETTFLSVAFLAVLTGMTATALGLEPRTGWAVFAFGVATIVGFSVAYHWEQARVAGEDPLAVEFEAPPIGAWHKETPRMTTPEKPQREPVTLAPLGVTHSGTNV